MRANLLLFLALLLTACTAVTPSLAPTATPLPSPTLPPTATPTPTPVPTPTPTPIPTLPPEQVGGLEGIPDPRVTNPELFDLARSDAPIPQFVKAMRMAGIEVDHQKVGDNLQYRPITGVDGKQYIIGSYYLDPNPQQQGETLEGKIPLFIWSKQGGWSEATFKQAQKVNGINIGTLLGGYGFAAEYNDLVRIQEKYFGYGSVNVTFNIWTTSGPNRLKLEDITSDVNIGKRNGMNMIGHNLIWPTQLPDWFKTGNYTREERLNFLQNWISTVIKRYPQIETWEVVNEAYDHDILRSTIGDDYLVYLYRFAREANPNATLIYNDYANHSQRDQSFPNGNQLERTKRIINMLDNEGLIDGVGVQFTLFATKLPNIDDVIETLRSYNKPVFITEFQVIMTGVEGSQEQRMLQQAEIYEKYTEALINSGVVKTIIFFNQSDRVSPFTNDPNLPGYSKNADPTLFDYDYNPKPAYYSVLRAFYNNLEFRQTISP